MSNNADNKDTQQNIPLAERIIKYKGYFQLGGVIAFIIVALLTSQLLHVTKKPLRQKELEKRTLFVDAASISPTTEAILFNTTGIIKPRANVEIIPQVSGRIVSVNDNVFAGGSFEAGELLFQIDPTDYQLAVKQLKATVAQAQTAYNLEEAESNIALAEWRQLNGKKKAPDLVARRPQLEEARANLQSAQAQLDDAMLDLERTVFSLPFKGRITSSSLSIGQYVSLGQSYGTAYKLEQLEIQASIAPTKLSWLLRAKDPEVKITTHYKGEQKTYHGFIKRTASELESSTRFARIAVGFSKDNTLAHQTSKSLLPGVFCELNITGPSVDGIFKLPANALQKDGKIWIIEGTQNSLRSVTPQIIYQNGEHILIHAFADHVLVVLGQISGATDGMNVNYQRISTNANSAETQ